MNTLAGVAFSLFVGIVIYAYRWMDSVKENHLTHIQADVTRTANAAVQTNAQLLELAIREDERHKQELAAFDDLKMLIRTRGL